MSPRERAEALGWVRMTCTGPRWIGHGEPVVWESADSYWYPCPRWLASGRVLGVRFGTEDEALEHALLLLDVWLS